MPCSSQTRLSLDAVPLEVPESIFGSMCPESGTAACGHWLINQPGSLWAWPGLPGTSVHANTYRVVKGHVYRGTEATKNRAPGQTR